MKFNLTIYLFFIFLVYLIKIFDQQIQFCFFSIWVNRNLVIHIENYIN